MTENNVYVTWQQQESPPFHVFIYPVNKNNALQPKISKKKKERTKNCPAMAHLTFLFFLISTLFLSSQAKLHLQPSRNQEESFTSILVSQQGLDFIKDLLINKAISSIIPLQLPATIEKSARIPFLGNVHMVISNVTIYKIDVLSSFVKPGNTGIAIVASGTTCNLTMNWHYSYSSWLVPIEISDGGRASVQVFFFSWSCYILYL